MDTFDRVMALLPHALAPNGTIVGEGLSEIRLRAGRPVQLRGAGWEWISEGCLPPDALGAIVTALMDYSVYARECELAQGFFTMGDGCRVGVCGRMIGAGRGAMASIGSICIRCAREMPGCADVLMPYIDAAQGLRSMLIASRPGMGKTTLLRDIARQLSGRGSCVALADERHELAACRDGAPTLDVGPRTDVMDGGERHASIAMLIRSMAPDVIVTDEIGGEGDAEALAEARRCGVCVIASAHAGSYHSIERRRDLQRAVAGGAFERIVLLGDSPGALSEIRDGEGRVLWKCA